MKIRKTILLESKGPSIESMKTPKINLVKIGELINSLNAIMAPAIYDDLLDVKKGVETKKQEYLDVINIAKKHKSEIDDMKNQKEIINKRIEIIALLGDLHSNYKVGENVKKESINILNEIESYSLKRLDLQITQLKKVLHLT